MGAWRAAKEGEERITPLKYNTDHTGIHTPNNRRPLQKTILTGLLRRSLQHPSPLGRLVLQSDQALPLVPHATEHLVQWTLRHFRRFWKARHVGAHPLHDRTNLGRRGVGNRFGRAPEGRGYFARSEIPRVHT